MRLSTLLPLVIAPLVAATSQALAQEEALYDPEPPPGAAYVRVINLTGVDDVAEVTIGGFAAGAIGDLQATPYVVVEEREPEIELGAALAVAAIEPGRFYSVIARADGMLVGLLLVEDDTACVALLSTEKVAGATE